MGNHKKSILVEFDNIKKLQIKTKVFAKVAFFKKKTTIRE